MLELSPDVFLKFVSSALENLPQTVHDALDNVEIVTQEWPSSEQVDGIEESDYYRLLGLYEGVPLTERGSHYGLVPPDKITIFQKPIEIEGSYDVEITAEIQRVIRHEIAHHFGLDDIKLEQLSSRGED